MIEYNTLDDFDIENKTILLRVDFNLPLDKKTLDILDTTRIKYAIPTIQELLNKNAKIVILAHQGRKGSWDFTDMQNHAKALQKIIKNTVTFVPDIYGAHAQATIKNMRNEDIIFLDNVRKIDGETHKKSPEEHAKSPLVQNLYPLADYFVNDAFAAAHRSQCSLVGFTPVLPSCAGRLLEKELSTLGTILKKPKKPSIFLFGGAKFSDTIVTIERILKNNIADKILLTGLPANAFLKANNINLGEKNENNLSEEATVDQFSQIKNLYAMYNNKIILPKDFAIDFQQQRVEIMIDDLPSNYPIYDIGKETIQIYKNHLINAKTIFLSGPCGVFENPLFQLGTTEIFTFIANLNGFSIVGGGHTVAAIKNLKIQDKINHISTGGGSLEKFMMGEKLPVVEALKKSRQQTIACG